MNGILALFVLFSEFALWFGAGRLAYLFFNSSKTLSYIMGIAAAALIILIWGTFFSPRARFRLKKALRIPLIVLLCLAVGYGLYLQNDTGYGLALMIGASLIQIAGQIQIHKD